MATNRYERLTIYVEDLGTLKRRASAWAKRIERDTGARVPQPVSAYVRFLIAKDAKGGSRG